MQFSVYRNSGAGSRGSIPYLLDVQSDLLNDISTRVVVPLVLRKSLKGSPITRLMPEFTIEGKTVVMFTPHIAGISLRELGESVTTLNSQRTKIVAALDILITGV